MQKIEPNGDGKSDVESMYSACRVASEPTKQSASLRMPTYTTYTNIHKLTCIK